MSGRNTSSDTAVGWYSRANVERVRAAHSDEDFEPLVTRQITHDASVVRVVFDDQQDGVVGLQVFAVVRNLLDRALRAGA